MDLAFTGPAPREFASSPGVLRSFCGHCGTPLTYRTEHRPLEVDITLCTLDDPVLAPPVDHIWMQDAPTWDAPSDGLPRYLQGRPVQIATPRLILVGADAALLTADGTGREALAAAARCMVPSSWPPEHHDQGVIDWVLRGLERISPFDPWRFYYIKLREPPTLVGTCGFKQAPDASGCVEVGYSVLAQFQGRGVASEAVLALMRVAFEAGASEVAAETYPSLVPSLRVMEKCGMTRVGPGAEPDSVRYSRRASDLADGKSTFAAPGG